MLEILLSMDPLVVAGFILSGLLLNVTPGVDFVLVTSSAINGGPRIGRAAATGITLGVLVHIFAAAAGVSALLLAYPAAYDVIRIIGAAYLVYLAWQAWTANSDAKTNAEGPPALSFDAALRRGFLTNVMNPKTALFIFAFIPQFTNPDIGPLWQQIVILGAIFAFNGYIFDLLLGTAAGHLAPFLRRHIRILNKLTAILFGGLAARLAFD